MSNEKTTKWQVKVYNKKTGKSMWTHLAYIPMEVKLRFLAATKYRGWSSGNWVDKWAREDFGIKYIQTWDDIYALREAIKDKYKKLYPELHEQPQTGVIDYLGWTRVWVVAKMKEETKNHENK